MWRVRAGAEGPRRAADGAARAVRQAGGSTSPPEGCPSLFPGRLVLEIAASAEGLAVAYSFDEYTQFVGSRYLLRIHRLNPSTLGSVRVAGLEGHFVSETGGWGAPAPISLDRLTLYPGSLEVSCSLEGDANSITEDPATAPWPYPIAQGSHFVAIYPDFFGATQPPPQIVTC
jgi:hypothetical protein